MAKGGIAMDKKKIIEMYVKGADEFALKVRKTYDHDFVAGRDIDEAFRGMPSSFRAMKELNATVKKALDETPLTVAERAALDAVAKEAERGARQVMQIACNDASVFLTEKAKKLAIDQQYFNCEFRNLPLSAKERIFDEAWDVAYERAHSAGFVDVMTEFSEIMDFAEKVVEATVAKGGEA